MRLIFTMLMLASFTSTAVANTWLPRVNVDAIVDSVLGKEPPQGNCYDGYHVKTTRLYNAHGKYVGKQVTCEEND